MYGDKMWKVLNQNSSKLGSCIYKDCSYVDFESRNFHGYYQNCQYQRDLAIPIVGPYSPSLSWFITQSGLCITKKNFLYVMIARIGIYACSGP